MKRATLILSIILAINAFAVDEVISVSGKCSKEIANNRGSITLKVVSKDMRAKRAIAESNRKFNQLSTALKVLKLKNMELQNTEYRVDQDYKWEKGKRTFLGHKATIGIRVETSEIKRIGEVIIAAKNNKVDKIGSLSMFLSNELKEKEYTKCLAVASKDAKRKAETMANALGVKVGKVVNIRESRFGPGAPPRPYPIAKSLRISDSVSAPPKIEAGTNRVNVTVDISFAIK